MIKYLIILLLVSSHSVLAREGLYLEVKIDTETENKNKLTYIRRMDSREKIQFHEGVPYFSNVETCILDKESDNLVTPECPFTMDYFRTKEVDKKQGHNTGKITDSIFFKIESVGHNSELITAVNDEAYFLTADSCSSDKKSCQFHLINKNSKKFIPLDIDISKKFLISYYVFKYQKKESHLVTREADTSEFKFQLTSDAWEYKDQYFKMKGTFLYVDGTDSSNSKPLIIDVQEFVKDKHVSIGQIGARGFLTSKGEDAAPFQAWQGVTNNNNGYGHLLNAFYYQITRVDDEIKWAYVESDKKKFRIDLSSCHNNTSNCEIIHFSDTPSEQRNKRLEKERNEKGNEHLNKLIKNLKPCVDTQNIDCIKSYFVQKNELIEEDEEGCMETSADFPDYQFSEADIVELRECFKYENLLPHLMGSKGINKVCLYAPLNRLKKKDYKLSGVLDPSLIKQSYARDYDESPVPIPKKDFAPEDYVPKDFSFKETLSYENLDKLPKERLYDSDLQGLYASKYSHALLKIPSDLRLDRSNVESMARNIYKFYYFLPVPLQKDPIVQSMSLRYENVYRNNISTYFNQKLVHPDFFYNEVYLERYFNEYCSYGKIETSHLDNDSQIFSMRDVFLKNIKYIKLIGNKCIPLRFRIDPEFLNELKRNSEWIRFFISPDYYSPEYFAAKYLRRDGSEKYATKGLLEKIVPLDGELPIFESYDFQFSLFKKYPWIIKYLDKEIKLNAKALKDGLAIHYRPSRFFNGEQLKRSEVLLFLKEFNVVNLDAKKKYQDYLLNGKFLGDELFEIMDPEFFNDEEFQSRFFSKRGTLRYLFMLGENVELSPNFKALLLKECARDYFYPFWTILRNDWAQKDSDFLDKFKKTCKK